MRSHAGSDGVEGSEDEDEEGDAEDGFFDDDDDDYDGDDTDVTADLDTMQASTSAPGLCRIVAERRRRTASSGEPRVFGAAQSGQRPPTRDADFITTMQDGCLEVLHSARSMAKRRSEMLSSPCVARTRFEDPGGAIEEAEWRPGTASDEVLDGEVPDGLPLVLADADPLEQLAVSERSGSGRRRPQAQRRKGPPRRR